ncbi:TonB family protein [bacterium]|nr:TonB family protein [bacterium]
MVSRNATILSGILHLAVISLLLIFAANPASKLQQPLRYRAVKLVSLPGQPGSVAVQPKVEPAKPKTIPTKVQEKIQEKLKPKTEPVAAAPTKASSGEQAKPVEQGKAEPARATEGKGEGGHGDMRLDGANFPYPYYLSSLQIKILSNFKPVINAREAKGLKAVVFFVIDRGGRISDVKLESKSGHFLFDQEAQRAVLRSNPLPALPPAFGSDQLGVHFEFVASE